MSQYQMNVIEGRIEFAERGQPSEYYVPILREDDWIDAIYHLIQSEQYTADFEECSNYFGE